MATTKTLLRQKRALDRLKEKYNALSEQMMAMLLQTPDLAFDIVNATLYKGLSSATHDCFLKLAKFAPIRHERNKLFWDELYPLLIKHGELSITLTDTDPEELKQKKRKQIDDQYALPPYTKEATLLSSTDYALAMSLFSIPVAYADFKRDLTSA